MWLFIIFLIVVLILCCLVNVDGFTYLPGKASTKHMLGKSWRLIKPYIKDSPWEPIGMAALLPLFGNILRFDYVLERKPLLGTSDLRYQVRRLDNLVILPIVENRELTNGAIVSIANASNPYAALMLVWIPDWPKKIQLPPPFPQADIINFP